MASRAAASWEDIHRDAAIIDLHAHPALKVSLFKRMLTRRLGASAAFDPLAVRTSFPKLKQGGVDVLMSSICAPEKGIYEECKYLKALQYLMPVTWWRVFHRTSFEVTLAQMAAMERRVKKSVNKETGKPFARIVRSVSEMDALLGEDGNRPIGVIHNVEGAHSLDGDLANLEDLFERGVAYLTIAHFYPNAAVYPCFPYPESVQILGCFKGGRNLALGLTDFGERLVEKMLELGIIIDVAHCTPPARERIYQIVGKRAPLIASHVGAYEINPSPYNLQDWEIEHIRDTGGVIGIIFMNYWLMPHETKRGVNFLTRTINHCVRVGGADHVAVGTDFDGFTDPPDDLRDASELERLTQRLVAEGYGAVDIDRIWGANVVRVLRQGWGKRT